MVSPHAKSCEACESNGCGSAKQKRDRSKEGSVTRTTQGPSSVPAKSDTTRSLVKRKPRKPTKKGKDANAHASPSYS